MFFRKGNKFKSNSYTITDDECIIKEKNNNKWSKINFEPMPIDYTGESKIINRYSCQQALINNPEGITEVWFTKEIQSNYLFTDIFSQIPRTIVLAKVLSSNTTILELLKIEDINNESSFITPKTVKSILENW